MLEQELYILSKLMEMEAPSEARRLRAKVELEALREPRRRPRVRSLLAGALVSVGSRLERLGDSMIMEPEMQE